MTIFEVLIVSLLLLVVLFLVIYYIRNNWVYDVRVELIRTDFEKYEKLPSYYEMFYKFWIWDVEKFIKEE